MRNYPSKLSLRFIPHSKQNHAHIIIVNYERMVTLNVPYFKLTFIRTLLI